MKCKHDAVARPYTDFLHAKGDGGEMAIHFGSARLCHCDACEEKRGRDDIARMVRLGILAP